MTNAKTTRKALLGSILSLLLCFTMLLSTTFAWFTDTVTSANNKIMAGNLDVQLLMYTGTTESFEGIPAGYVEITDNSNPIFGDGSIAQNDNAATLWEPGKTQVAYLAIKNAGSLDLKYKVDLKVENKAKDLYKVMKYAIVADATPEAKVTGWTEGLSVLPGVNATQAKNVVLEADAIHYFALVIHMEETAGNEYQGGQVNFDICVQAAQLASEEDSFGADYDSAATYDDGAFIVNAVEMSATAAAAGEEVTVANDDNTFTVTATAASADAPVIATIAPANTTEAVFEVATNNGLSVLSYDVNVTGQKVGSSVTFALFIGKGLTDVSVYHEGVEMTSGFSYDPVTGYVTVTTTSFSPFEVVFSYPETDNDTPLAKVTKIDPKKVNATLGMGGAASEYDLAVAYSFETTQTYEEAQAGEYAKYHADFVVSSNKDIPANAVALVGYYEAYCNSFNNNNWVALQSDDVFKANTPVRLLDVLFGGDGTGVDPETGLTAGSINYEELCNWIPKFDCGIAQLADVAEGTTITVELRMYEVEEPSESNGNSWNKETGKSFTVCTYTYTFD